MQYSLVPTIKPLIIIASWMSSKASQIRSKKQKMHDKREEKHRANDYDFKSNNNRPYEIPDSSSSSSVEIFASIPGLIKEAKETVAQDQRRRSSERTYNNFNYDKFKKVSGPVMGERKPFVLGVEQCEDAIDLNRVQDLKPINYKKAGSKITHKTSQTFLKTRIEQIEENHLTEKQQPKEQGSDQKQDNNEPTEIKQPQQKPEKLQRIPRYFDDEIASSNQSNSAENQSPEQQTAKSVRCFRCGQKGHIARMCDQQQVLKCVYCLGNHQQSYCTDKVCRNCNEVGHVKSDCRARFDRAKCQKCGRYGHLAKQCGRIIMMNYNSAREREIRQRYSRYDLEKLKCLKCNLHKDSKGHFNCHEYSSRINRIYLEQRA